MRRVTSWISEELRCALLRSDSSGLIQRLAEAQIRFAMLFVICLKTYSYNKKPESLCYEHKRMSAFVQSWTAAGFKIPQKI